MTAPRTMTAVEFRAAIGDLFGYRGAQKRIARALGRDVNTVSRWARGAAPVPPEVAALLEALTFLRAANRAFPSRWTDDQVAPTDRPPLLDRIVKSGGSLGAPGQAGVARAGRAAKIGIIADCEPGQRLDLADGTQAVYMAKIGTGQRHFWARLAIRLDTDGQAELPQWTTPAKVAIRDLAHVYPHRIPDLLLKDDLTPWFP